jgi:hypothetical protein
MSKEKPEIKINTEEDKKLVEFFSLLLELDKENNPDFYKYGRHDNSQDSKESI